MFTREWIEAIPGEHGGMVDLSKRATRLDKFLSTGDTEAVWFATPASFAWLTGGDNRVDRTAPVGEAAIGYDGDWRIVTNNIEAERLAAEELPPEFTASVRTYDWHAGELAEAVASISSTPAAADFDVPSLDRIDPTPLRIRLTPGDIDRYRGLGREVAAAVETVCRELEPEDTEAEVAAGIRIALAARGIDAPVVLVGGSRRAQQYRHYTPTDASLDEYALVSVTAARDGLHASLTRTVAFDSTDALVTRHRAAMKIDARALAATRRAAARTEGWSDPSDQDGRGTAAAVFDEIQRAYADAEYPEEWKRHHQGGATGYAGREWFATPDSTHRVTGPTAYAWNPTVAGCKSEDTALVTAEGIEILTKTGEWPTERIDTPEASILRHDLLQA